MFTVSDELDEQVNRSGFLRRNVHEVACFLGERGWAYTLVTDKDGKDIAGHLVRNLESVNQPVPDKLLEMANQVRISICRNFSIASLPRAFQSSWFRKSRFRQGKGKKPQIGGRGLGYTESGSNQATSKCFRPL